MTRCCQQLGVLDQEIRAAFVPALTLISWVIPFEPQQQGNGPEELVIYSTSAPSPQLPAASLDHPDILEAHPARPSSHRV